MTAGTGPARDAATRPGSGPSGPRITVITAVFNAAATVGQAIGSVAAQSHPEIEHLVLDGGSTDGTLAAIRAAAHPGLVVTSAPDDGIYDALNKGIARATGEVVGLVHADDFLAHARVLERVAAAFADPAVEAVYGDLDYVGQADTARVVRHWVSGAYSPARLRRGWMPPHPTLFLRRAVFDRIGTYDTGLRIAADYDLILRYFAQARVDPVYLPEVLVKMRVGGVSNRSLGKVLRKSREDYLALRRNGIGGAPALAWKNLSKLPQFVAARRNRAAPE